MIISEVTTRYFSSLSALKNICALLLKYWTCDRVLDTGKPFSVMVQDKSDRKVYEFVNILYCICPPLSKISIAWLALNIHALKSRLVRTSDKKLRFFSNTYFHNYKTDSQDGIINVVFTSVSLFGPFSVDAESEFGEL